MLYLIEINFRPGVPIAEGRPAATLLRDRLEKPLPGTKILNSVADIGGSRVVLLADLNEEAMSNVEETLKFRTLSAVERFTVTPVVEAMKTLDTYLKM